MPTDYYSRTPWFYKFCESFLAIIAILNVLMMGLELIPRSFWEQYGQYMEFIFLSPAGVGLVVGAVYTWLWHRRETAGTVNSALRHAWLQGIIRYWLALSISTYGFAKILKTQFQTPGYRLDMPLGDVSGFGLTWYYFGYSYTLAVLIGLLQIVGSVLLLYRRTTLLGVMILLPVMVNIVLINTFYDIAVGAFYNSVVFTLGLVFLLATDWDKLRQAFWDLVDRLPPVTLGRQWVKHALRVLPIALAFAMIESFVLQDKSDTLLMGTWQVKQLTRNGQTVAATSWLTDTTAWNRVYFSGRYGCAFSPNPYRYKPEESLRGEYEFDSTVNQLQVVFHGDSNKKDTLQAHVSQRTTKAMNLKGVLKGDTLAMHLTRLR